MSHLLRDYLYSSYARFGENLACDNNRMTHLTLYAGNSFALVRHRTPREKVSGVSSRPSSIHVYGITDMAFVLELRNPPMSVATEQFIQEAGAEIDRGQSHGTVRITLQPSDTQFVRRLAELIRGVPRAGRIDRLAGAGSEAYAVHRALIGLARCLEAYESHSQGRKVATCPEIE